MYHITEFKPALYLLILLGITGFAMASQSVGLWIVGIGGLALNAWLVFTHRFRPLPRVLANLVTIFALLFVARQLVPDPSGAVMIIGQFLVVLQLVKLWEQRYNRDYGQLLVLSLLLMVAASINTVSLAFGVLLAFYLFLSLYCCLLFHLKVEADNAKAAYALPQERVNPCVLQQDQRYLARSMRRLAAIVSVASLAVAVVVFVMFPRGSPAGLLGPTQSRTQQVSTGFSDQMSFDQVARIQQDDRIVAYAQVTKNGSMMGAGDTLYLRGITQDRYRANGAGQWLRESPDASQVQAVNDSQVSIQGSMQGLTQPITGTRDNYIQRITLSPTDTRVLFSIAGPRFITVKRDMQLDYGFDDTLQAHKTLDSTIEYEVTSSGHVQQFERDIGRPDPEVEPFQLDTVTNPQTKESVPALKVWMPFWGGGSDSFRPRRRVSTTPFARMFGLREGDSVIAIENVAVKDIAPGQRIARAGDARRRAAPMTVIRDGRIITIPTVIPQVDAYARLPNVSGVDDKGNSLAAMRPRSEVVSEFDLEIARNIERHLRSEFSYTLDITDAKTRGDNDPIVWFLSEDGRRGHCQYFAGAMTLMCQSLGMNARVVLGFRCDEYNPFTNQFVVRQSQAHSWVEVLTKDGWKTFDPTSSRGAEARQAEYGWWQQLKHLVNWLEFNYANNIIAYDNDSRENLIQAAESRLTQPLYAGVNEGWITRRFTDSKLYKLLAGVGSSVMSWLIAGVMLAVVAFSLRWFLRKWKLRKRAARIGLGVLPQAEQLRLAQQLEFYDDLLQLLEKRKIARKPQQTPLEFSRSLFFLPSDAYETIHRLTELFYRVRYGTAELSAGSQKRLGNVIVKLDAGLGREGGVVG